MHKKIRIQFGLSYSGNPKSKIANPKWVGIITYVISFAFCGVVGAQPAKIPLIGNLQGAPLAAVSALTGAFRQGLRELEYVEGKNI
ncbi:MAG: hypothetical protein ACXWW4_11225, partial [Candidatus Binatia bacterium]